MEIPADYRAVPNSEHRLRRNASSVGLSDPDEQMSVSIVVRRRADAPPLLSQDHWIKTPPGQRNFLSREDFAARFGADSSDLESVASFGRANGLTVVESSSAKRIVWLSGTASQMSAAFADDNERVGGCDQHYCCGYYEQSNCTHH
jgi:kumamolisin